MLEKEIKKKYTKKKKHNKIFLCNSGTIDFDIILKKLLH